MKISSNLRTAMRKFVLATLIVWNALFIFAGLAYASEVTALQNWALHRLQQSTAVDLNEYCNESHNLLPSCAHMSGSLLKRLLSNETAAKLERVAIKNIYITDIVDLSESTLNYTLIINKCHFNSPLFLVGAYLKQDLVLDGSIFTKGIGADNLHVDGQLLIREHNKTANDADFTDSFIKSGIVIADSIFTGKLILRRSRLGGNLLIQTSDLRSGLDANFMDIGGSLHMGSGAAISGLPLILDGTTVSGRFDVYQTHLLSPVMARNMTIGDDVFFTESTSAPGDLDRPSIDMDGSQVQGDLVVDDSAFHNSFNAERLRLLGSMVIVDDPHFVGRLNIDDSSVGGVLSLKSTTLSSGIAADRAKIHGSVLINSSSLLGPSRLIDSVVDGDVNIENTNVSGPEILQNSDDGALYAKGIRVGGTMYLGPKLRETGGGINLLEAHIAGNIEISDLNATSDFSLTLSHVDHSIFIHNSIFGKNLSIYSAIIGQHLDLSGNEFHDVDLARTKIDADLRLEPDEKHNYKLPTRWVTGSTLSLNSTDVKTIQDEYSRRDSLPHYMAWPKIIDFSEFTYRQFGDARDYVWALDWLRRQKVNPAFAASDNDLAYQPSRALGAYFKALGDDDNGDNVLIDSKNLELQTSVNACRNRSGFGFCAKALKLWLSKYAVNYGIGNWTGLIFAWSLFFIALGFAVLSSLEKKDRRFDVPWRLGASLNRLIPVLNLNKDFEKFFDEPVRTSEMSRKQIYYFYFHALAGYILALFIVAAFTGMIQPK